MSNINMEINIAGIKMKNPVMTASGTFAYGREYSEYIDLNKLGAIVVKGTSIEPWKGNKPPRIAETPSGILNSIGLQNPGVDHFIKEDLPFLLNFDTPIIVNVVGKTVEEYCRVIEMLNDKPIAGYELNISCPNVKEGGVAFGTNPLMAAEITSKIKKISKKPLIVKLSPNVTDITEIAKAVENAGADAISLINTLLGMVIDINSKRPVLANNVGGLSGPAVKPVAVRMVWQVANAVKIPVIGMGGIMSGNDAIEFMLAGASAVEVGTATFVNPNATIEIIDGIKNYMIKYDYENLDQIIGKVELNK